MTGSKIIAGSSSKNMTPNFLVVASVLMPLFRHIGFGRPKLCIFVEEVAAFIGEMTDKWV